MPRLRHMPMALDRVGELRRVRHGSYYNLSQLCNRCGIRKEVRQLSEFYICAECKMVDPWYVKMTRTQEEPCHA